MQINVTKKLGGTAYTFVIDEPKVEKAFNEAAHLDRQIPEKCGYPDCQSDNVRLTSQEKDAFTFIKIVCFKCRGFKKLGQKKDGSGWFFWDWAKYNPETKETVAIVRPERSNAPAAKTADPATSNTSTGDLDDLPF